MEPDLEKLTMKELYEMAEHLGVQVPAKCRKAELVGILDDTTHSSGAEPECTVEEVADPKEVAGAKIRTTINMTRNFLDRIGRKHAPYTVNEIATMIKKLQEAKSDLDLILGG